MVYEVTKKVNGYFYKYLVMSYRDEQTKKPKIKILKYLGKAKELNKLPQLIKDQCKICGSKENLSIDHIIPLSKKGNNDLSNLQILCIKCNQKKGKK